MWLEILKWTSISIVLLFTILFFWSYFDYQKERTEALRKVACTLMGLSSSTKMKEFKKMHKESKERR